MAVDDLRTRIAAATVGHADYVSAGIRYCTCGQWSGDSPSTRIGFCLHVADAVIRELNLTLEESYGTTYPNLPVEDRRLTRWVTEWKADE